MARLGEQIMPNLHSTMVLLLHRSPLRIIGRDIHLHSTMVLLLRVFFCPLSYSSVHLHSTMVLLLLVSDVPLAVITTEFTFHYGSTSTRSNRGSSFLHSIYIPLWFYFYGRSISWLSSRFKFTFHYGSTSTDTHRQLAGLCANLHSTMVLLLPWRNSCLPQALSPFTFHYGSTSTEQK